MSRFYVNGEAVRELPTLSWTFEDYMKNKAYVTSLAWSPWQLEGRIDPTLGGQR